MIYGAKNVSPISCQVNLFFALSIVPHLICCCRILRGSLESNETEFFPRGGRNTVRPGRQQTIDITFVYINKNLLDITFILDLYLVKNVTT